MGTTTVVGYFASLPSFVNQILTYILGLAITTCLLVGVSGRNVRKVKFLNLLATQKVLQVGSHGYNLNNSLSISLFLSCFIEKKYLHGNMRTYITFLWAWGCSKTSEECTPIEPPLQQNNNKSLVLAMGFYPTHRAFYWFLKTW